MSYRNARSTDDGHTRIEGECKFPAPQGGKTPGQYPRDPRPMATTHPSAEASGYDASLDTEEPGGGVHGDANPPSASASSSGPHEDPAQRGRPEGALDSEPRTRRTYADTGSGTARLPD